MEPLEYLRALRRRWPVIAVTVALAAAVVWWVTPETPDGQESGRGASTYTATHTLYQGASRSRESELDTMALLATRGEIPARVIERLGLDIEPQMLVTEVTITAESRQGTLTITATHADGERAALVANTFAEEIVTYFEEQLEERDQQAIARTTQQMERQQSRIRDLDEQMRAVPEESVDAEILRSQRDALIRQYGTNVDLLEQLETREPISLGLYTLEEAVPVPNLDLSGGFEPPATRESRLPIALALGLVLGAGLALALDHLDTRVRTRRGAENAFGLPVIAEVPKLRRPDRRHGRVTTAVQPNSDVAEAYRILRLSLQLMPRWILANPGPTRNDAPSDAPQKNSSGAGPSTVTSPPKVVLVTSAGAGEGKTVTVANLAASYAEAGKSVCVLDCDLRRSELHRYLGAKDRPGVTDYVAGNGDSIRPYTQQTTVPGVSLVPGGTPVANPGEVLGPEQGLIAAAGQEADVVIVDSGPLLRVNDPAALLPHIDAVVVVARSGRTSGEAAYRTRELLARLHAPVLGVTLVALPRGLVSGGYYRQRSAAESDWRRPRPTPPHEGAWSTGPALGGEDRA